MIVEGIIVFFGIFVVVLGVVAVLMFGLCIVKLIQNFKIFFVRFFQQFDGSYQNIEVKYVQ